MENRDVARILRETAQLLEIDGAIVGRYRSYEKAAELLESIPERVEDLAKDDEKLTELPGIGDNMAHHIREILSTGDYSLRTKLRNKYPPTLLDVLNLQSLGPKKVAFLWKAFGAATVADVEKLAREEKLRDLPGFGKRSEENILKAIEVFKRSTGRFRINTAEAAAEKLRDYILKSPSVEETTIAGSVRRSRDTIGDLDLIVTMRLGTDEQTHIDEVAEYILKYGAIDQVLAHGENKVSFVLSTGLQVDVRMLPKKCAGAALLYFTGSKEHNVVLRGRANDMGWTLNEYELSDIETGKSLAGKTEEEIYARLDLAFIPPELRENSGEIPAAEARRLPNLVTLEDIRGDLQMHTVASDGKHSIEEMAETAKTLGYEYIAITDHSKAVSVANGLDEKRTLEQIKKIHSAQKNVPGIRLLAGMEVDILKDGRLDLDNEVLAQLDVVVVSVHGYQNLERAAMTDRILAAIANPYAQIVAHPTGRLILRREAFEYDMERVFDAAKAAGVAMECNAYPDRLDLKDVHLRLARDRGVKIVISTDAHATNQLSMMKYGVRTARRGWIEKKDVLNTLPLKEFQAALRPKSAGSVSTPPTSAALTTPAKPAPQPSLPLDSQVGKVGKAGRARSA